MTLRRLGRAALMGAAVAALAGLGTLIAAQTGMFAGTRPADLGVRDGRLRVGDARPNWVSSQVAPADAKHFIAPIRISGDAELAWNGLVAAILAEPRAKIVDRKPDYVHAEFESRMMGFVDDAEFALDRDQGVIHVHSGARLGVRDFNVNRERLERIRASLKSTGRAAGP